jgi:hypothetical protein
MIDGMINKKEKGKRNQTIHRWILLFKTVSGTGQTAAFLHMHLALQTF